MIGSSAATADAEMILLASTALSQLGLDEQSVDVTMPPLVPALCADLDLDADTTLALRRALDRKDLEAVRQLGGSISEILGGLLSVAGPADACFSALEKLDLPPAAAAERGRVGEVLALLRDNADGLDLNLTLTLDPVENRGFEYHSGVSFTIFAPGVRGELGSGGRYLADAGGNGPLSGDPSTGNGEPATGFTLYVDTILRTLPAPKPEKRLFVPAGTAMARVNALRNDGWVAVMGLETVADLVAEARRMGCSHVLAADDKIQPIGEK